MKDWQASGSISLQVCNTWCVLGEERRMGLASLLDDEPIKPSCLQHLDVEINKGLYI